MPDSPRRWQNSRLRTPTIQADDLNMETLTISTLLRSKIVDRQGNSLTIVDLICKKLTLISKAGRTVEKIGESMDRGETTQRERHFILEQFSKHPQTMKLFPSYVMVLKVMKYGNAEQKHRVNSYVLENLVELANNRWANSYIQYHIRDFPCTKINQEIINNFNELVQNEKGKYVVRALIYDVFPKIQRQHEICEYIEKIVCVFNDHAECSRGLNANLARAFQDFLYFINESEWSREAAWKYVTIQSSVRLYNKLIDDESFCQERKFELEKNFAVKIYRQLQKTLVRKAQQDNYLEQLNQHSGKFLSE
jgi:hypothetical protein